MKPLLIVILIFVLVVVVFTFFNQKEETISPGAIETSTPQETIGASIRKQGALKDVSGGSSSGIAQTLFDNGKFTHAVIALMPDPELGKFYEGWLVKREDSKVINFFSTGKMTKEGGSYILNFEDTKDYPEHNSVVITLEVVDDKKPEKHILDGDLELATNP